MALCSWKPTWVCWEWANVWCQDGFWRCVRELKLFDCVCKGFQKALLGILGHGNRVGVTFGVLRNGESRDSNRGRAETQSFRHRFSAFWLRSKCSICSYQLNIWYGLHCRSRILNWFLNLGEVVRGLLHLRHGLTWYCSTSRNGPLLSWGEI